MQISLNTDFKKIMKLIPLLGLINTTAFFFQYLSVNFVNLFIIHVVPHWEVSCTNDAAADVDTNHDHGLMA